MLDRNVLHTECFCEVERDEKCEEKLQGGYGFRVHIPLLAVDG